MKREEHDRYGTIHLWEVIGHTYAHVFEEVFQGLYDKRYNIIEVVFTRLTIVFICFDVDYSKP